VWVECRIETTTRKFVGGAEIRLVESRSRDEDIDLRQHLHLLELSDSERAPNTARVFTNWVLPGS